MCVVLAARPAVGFKGLRVQQTRVRDLTRPRPAPIRAPPPPIAPLSSTSTPCLCSTRDRLLDKLNVFSFQTKSLFTWDPTVSM